MEPENPPRRTRADQEPLTIDLEATREQAGATPPRTPEADATEQGAVSSEEAADDAVAKRSASGWQDH